MYNIYYIYYTDLISGGERFAGVGETLEEKSVPLLPEVNDQPSRVAVQGELEPVVYGYSHPPAVAAASVLLAVTAQFCGVE